MKKILTFTMLAVITVTAHAARSTPHFKNVYRRVPVVTEKDKISLVSSRKTGELEVRYAGEDTGQAVITILDGTGTMVLQQTSWLTGSINTMPIKNATSLPEGSYTLRLMINNQWYTSRFLIWK